MSENNPRLSVVIPARNEAGNIGPLVQEVRAALADTPHEVIVIDDGSGDATGDEVRGCGQRPGSRLRLMTQVSSCGQSTGIRLGTEQARAPLVATLDGDRQNDPADLPDMLACISADDRIGLVQGVRRKRQDSWIRLVSSRVANAVRSRALGDDFPDSGCGIKIFRRDAALRLPYFDHMHRFMPALFRLYGFEVVAHDVRHRSRVVGQSNYGLFDRLWVGIVDLFGMWWLRRRYRRPAEGAIRIEDIE